LEHRRWHDVLVCRLNRQANRRDVRSDCPIKNGDWICSLVECALRRAERKNPNAVKPLLALPQKIERRCDAGEANKKATIETFHATSQRERGKTSIVAFELALPCVAAAIS
jgi:hypothetical protein